MNDSTTVARKILSCVARVKQTWGIGHVTDVLVGKAQGEASGHLLGRVEVGRVRGEDEAEVDGHGLFHRQQIDLDGGEMFAALGQIVENQIVVESKFTHGGLGSQLPDTLKCW